MSAERPRVRLGVDVGGTFTDLVALVDDELVTAKVLSTPRDQAQGVVRSVEAAAVDAHAVASFAHGSTVATNALLERRGARVALVTTDGFRDVLEIGRQNRPALYDLTADPGASKNIVQSSKGTADTIAAQLDAFDKRFTAGSKATELSSSEMQKLASLGYVGLQKGGSATTAATGTDPKDAIGFANKIEAALQALQDGKPEKAVPILQQVVTSSPNAYLAQYGLGSGLAQQQQCSKAVDPLRKAIELQPDSPWAHFEMASCLIKNGDFKTAIVHLEIATSRLPESGEAFALLAQAYEHNGRAEDARKARTKAAQLGMKI